MLARAVREVYRRVMIRLSGVIIRCRLRSRLRAKGAGPTEQRLVVWTMIGENSWLRRGVSRVITGVESVVALDSTAARSNTDGICMLLHGPIVG